MRRWSFVRLCVSELWTDLDQIFRSTGSENGLIWGISILHGKGPEDQILTTVLPPTPCYDILTGGGDFSGSTRFRNPKNGALEAQMLGNTYVRPLCISYGGKICVVTKLEKV